MRRCGFLRPEEREPGARPVWLRHGATAMECPVSLIRPESIRWLESHVLRGDRAAGEVEARTWEAWQVIEEEQVRVRDEQSQ